MIKLHSITKSYYKGNKIIPVLKEIDLEVQPKDFVAIMGESGSGKTTLMNIIGCLDNATSGKFFLNGREINFDDEHKLASIRNQKIGFIFQNFHLLSRYNIITNVELPLMYAGKKKSERLRKAEAALEKVGLSERLYYYPYQLSGGQKQRVAIARAIVNNPDLIIADEPTGSLDLDSSTQIMEIISQLNKDGATVILVTHDKKIANYANAILILKEGKIVKGS